VSAQPFKIVKDDRKHENVYDRAAARERVELLTVRENTHRHWRPFDSRGL